MNTKILFLFAFAVSLSVAHAAPETPSQVLQKMFDEGTGTSFSELDNAFWVGSCFTPTAIETSFGVVVAGFKRSFGQGRGPLLPSFEKGFVLASFHPANQNFGTVSDADFLQVTRIKNYYMQNAPESQGCWDSRSTEGSPCLSTKILLPNGFMTANGSSTHLRTSGDYLILNIGFVNAAANWVVQAHCYLVPKQ